MRKPIIGRIVAFWIPVCINEKGSPGGDPCLSIKRSDGYSSLEITGIRDQDHEQKKFPSFLIINNSAMCLFIHGGKKY
jgi:hypothetical protein